MRRLFSFALILCALYSAQAQEWVAGTTVTPEQIAEQGVDSFFDSEPISDAIFERMRGKSYKADCTIPRSELRYIKALHITREGVTKRGEMVVNSAISGDIVAILKQLYKAGYPIERMELVDNYGADDNRSMAANNFSAFNYRTTPGGTRLSAHSRGMAVDINPLYNPYIRRTESRTIIAPKEGSDFVDRSKKFAYKIERNDLCCRLFLERGFEWGGDYKTIKDYQHFEK